MIVRAARAADAPAVGAIYAHYVLTSLVTFEETAPDDAEMRARIAAVQAQGLPHLVAEDADGRIVGSAYASPFRLRPAYRYTAEDTVYVHPEFHGRGLGRALVSQVIADCEARGVRQLLAVIGDSANAGSIGLHRSLGFREMGVGPGFGFKFGRWVDIVLMHRTLGEGEATLPRRQGLTL